MIHPDLPTDTKIEKLKINDDFTLCVQLIPRLILFSHRGSRQMVNNLRSMHCHLIRRYTRITIMCILLMNVESWITQKRKRVWRGDRKCNWNFKLVSINRTENVLRPSRSSAYFWLRLYIFSKVNISVRIHFFFSKVVHSFSFVWTNSSR